MNNTKWILNDILFETTDMTPGAEELRAKTLAALTEVAEVEALVTQIAKRLGCLPSFADFNLRGNHHLLDAIDKLKANQEELLEVIENLLKYPQPAGMSLFSDGEVEAAHERHRKSVAQARAVIEKTKRASEL